MLIKHLVDEDLWLITLGNITLYKGANKPWESMTLWNEILKKKWRIEEA